VIAGASECFPVFSQHDYFLVLYDKATTVYADAEHL